MIGTLTLKTSRKPAQQAPQISEAVPTPTPTPQAKRALRALVEAYAGMFPHLFNQDSPVPLAIGIAKPLKLAVGLSWNEVRRLLHWWCSRPEYHQAVMTMSGRIGLDGNVTEIMDGEREHARLELAQIAQDKRGQGNDKG